MRNSILFITLLASFNLKAATPDCRVVEVIGNGGANLITEKINDQVRGVRKKISRRKTLILKDVRELNFQGCQLTLKLQATLKRKIRRNAHGTITVKANVKSFARDQVCLNKIRVSKVSFSRTLNIGEAAYKWAANRALPNNSCYNF